MEDLKKIFSLHYKELNTYANNLLFKMPWVKSKGFTGQDILHEAYIKSDKYRDKFINCTEEQYTQILKNFVFWTVKEISKKATGREFSMEEMVNFWMFEPSGLSEGENVIYNQEIKRFKKTLTSTEEEIFNLQLSGYSYREINQEKQIHNSETILQIVKNKGVAFFEIHGKDHNLQSQFLQFIKEKKSIRHIQAVTKLGNFKIKQQLKALLGNKYDDYIHYTKHNSKKRKRER